MTARRWFTVGLVAYTVAVVAVAVLTAAPAGERCALVGGQTVSRTSSSVFPVEQVCP